MHAYFEPGEIHTIAAVEVGQQVQVQCEFATYHQAGERYIAVLARCELES